MYRTRTHQHTSGFRMATVPVGIALTLLLAGCGSASTPGVASRASSSVSPSSSAAAPTGSPAPVSPAPVSPAPVSPAPVSSAPVSSAPAPASAAPASSAPASSAPASSAVDSGSVSASAELPVATVNTTDAQAKKVLGAMNAAMLTTTELGTGFTKTEAVPDDRTIPLPCGGPSAVALYPNELHAEFNAVQGQNVQFQESLRLYLDADTAKKAFDTTVAGLACSKGTISGTAVTIGKPQDVTADVGGTKALAWEVTVDGATGVLIAVESGPVNVGYTFIAATGVDSSKLPNPLTLAKKATAKIAAGLS